MNRRASSVKDRSDLARVLREAMEDSYVRFVEGHDAEAERNLLKSYLLEVHLDASDDRLRTGFHELRRIGKRLNARVAKTDDPSLLTLSSGSRNVEFFVDLLHERFWFLHTLSKSSDTDPFLAHLIKSSPRIDRAWFPSRILEVTSELGRFEGFGVRFDSTIYHSDEGDPVAEDEDTTWNPLDNRLISLSLKTRKGARGQLTS